MKILNLHIPALEDIDTVSGDQRPFCLRPLAGRPLLHHWLDYALDMRYDKIVFRSSGRKLGIQELIDEATIWPVEKEYVTGAYLPDEENTFILDSIPGISSPIKPSSGWDLLDLSLALEAICLDRLFASDSATSTNAAVGSCCSIHKNVRLCAPYFIGNNVRVGDGATIGPYAVIGDGSVISDHASVRHGRVEAATFLGIHTDLRDAVLRENCLLSLKNRATVNITDAFFASKIEVSLRRRRASIKLSKWIDNFMLPIGINYRKGKEKLIVA